MLLEKQLLFIRLLKSCLKKNYGGIVDLQCVSFCGTAN